jgi:hypothetical protein
MDDIYISRAGCYFCSIDLHRCICTYGTAYIYDQANFYMYMYIDIEPHDYDDIQYHHDGIEIMICFSNAYDLDRFSVGTTI